MENFFQQCIEEGCEQVNLKVIERESIINCNRTGYPGIASVSSYIAGGMQLDSSTSTRTFGCAAELSLSSVCLLNLFGGFLKLSVDLGGMWGEEREGKFCCTVKSPSASKLFIWIPPCGYNSICRNVIADKFCIFYNCF